MKTKDQIRNKRDIAREIGRMPYYQVYYTQKGIIEAMKNNEIPEMVIERAKQKVANKINEFGKAF
jgi:translation initiation factor 2 beta subunit (eIF-2beta)/eIF-5